MSAALAALLVACASVQDADAARARLAALVESTNALAGFRAEYVLARGEEELGKVELAYLAPDRLTMSNGSEQGWARFGIDGGQLWMVSESPAAGALAGAYDLDDAGGDFEQALAALHAAFPRPADQVDVGVRLDWGINATTDKTEFNLSLAYVRGGEERLLGWLHSLATLEGELSLADGLLVHVSPRLRAEVDAETGFLRRLHMVGAEGEERELRLVSLDLEGPFDADAFLRPKVEEGARDVSQALRGQLFSPSSLRADCLLWIDRQLADGRAWDADTQKGARAFLEALHRPVLAANVARWRAGALAGIDAFAEDLARRRAEGEDEDALRTEVDTRRAELLVGIDTTLGRLRESLATATRNPTPSAHWVDLRTLEDQVLGELFADEVERPLLEAFDERT